MNQNEQIYMGNRKSNKWNNIKKILNNSNKFHKERIIIL
jgi:hypothetical protein